MSGPFERAFQRAYQVLRRRSVFPAILGDGNDNLVVSDRTGFAYCRVRMPESQTLTVMEVRCRKTPEMYGAPVLIRRGFDDVWEVIHTPLVGWRSGHARQPSIVARLGLSK